MKFSYSNSTVIHFGQGQISTISSSIPKQAKTLVVYGGGSIKTNGIYDQVVSALSEHSWIEFSGVEANPTKETLDKAIALAKSESVDFILAVGGGSVIDGSKYIAAAALHDGDSWDLVTRKYTVEAAIPLGAVLTLPATGSESNMGAVVTKRATNEKLSFMSPAVRPAFAVLDPNAMKTLPERQLINGLVDAWVHVCEQYITFPTGNMVQDGYAEVLLKNLLTLGKEFGQQDDAWRENLMWTANQSLNGLIGAGMPQDWATHMIGHELTALWHVDHARSLAIVQPSLLRNQIEAKRGKLEQMGRNVFGLTDKPTLAEETIDAIESFYISLNVDTVLSEVPGDKSEAIDQIVDKLKQNGYLALGEHQAITLNVAREILVKAL
ncbi:aldehyde reductase [Vibrio sp. 10N.286.49.C2]|uniref:iron-containing alcohol dehydrogenase n=1 Tax=unclassified Vibrio TaxID=2614977 RepID=UPI000C81D9FB|nr:MULTISPECIES: iron-containing alcohol dehydrogenase [unclassified Vibrio]PMH25420.1 aldehyde reductase [Vibrio sp. 10N.286.49.C2]PMH51276.1 aldehyde reductase [Vibrio sp. 10N.286.49.B1]PMH81564.1 aldehyde reductase [Vibrio sp. 10N.286.48.B7]